MNIFKKLFNIKPNIPKLGDWDYTYGFKNGDFIKLYFGKSRKSKIARVEGFPGDRIYLTFIDKPFKDSRSFVYQSGIYEIGILDGCNLCTYKDNKKILEFLNDGFVPETAGKHYTNWLKRIGELE